MDLPFFWLSSYRRLHPRLRPEIDHERVGNLMSIVEVSGGMPKHKATVRLQNHLESARLRRDVGLSVAVRRAVRAWEQSYVDCEAKPEATPGFVPHGSPACYGPWDPDEEHAFCADGGDIPPASYLGGPQ